MRDSEKRFLVDEEFRNGFIGKFNETFAKADADKDGVLNKKEFMNYQELWAEWTSAQNVPKNWDSSKGDTWYDFFNGETQGVEGVSAGDLMTGTMKYTDKIRTFLGLQ